MTNRAPNHRWRLVLVLGIATLLSLSGDLTLYAILPVDAGGLPLTLAQVGVLLSANRFVRLFSNPLTGYLLDRGKRRPIYLSGMLLGTLSTLIYAHTRLFGVLLIGRLVWGFAWSFINVGGTTMVVDSTQPSDRGRFLGILNLMLSLGLALNPLIGGFLADAVGFRPTMLFCALLTGTGFLLTVFLLPETRPDPTEKSPHKDLPNAPLTPATSRPAWLTRLRGFDPRVLGWGTWLAIFLTLILFFAGNGLIMATIGRFLALEVAGGVTVWGTFLGISALTGMALSTRSLLIGVAAPLSGAFSDRGHSRWPAVLIGLGFGAAGMLALGGLPTAPALVVGISLIAVGEGVLLTVLPAIVGDGTPLSQRGRAMGLTFVAGDLGSALAPLLVYSLLALIPLRTVYLASAGAFGLGIMLVILRIVNSE